MGPTDEVVKIDSRQRRPRAFTYTRMWREITIPIVGAPHRIYPRAVDGTIRYELVERKVAESFAVAHAWHPAGIVHGQGPIRMGHERGVLRLPVNTVVS